MEIWLKYQYNLPHSKSTSPVGMIPRYHRGLLLSNGRHNKKKERICQMLTFFCLLVESHGRKDPKKNHHQRNPSSSPCRSPSPSEVGTASRRVATNHSIGLGRIRQRSQNIKDLANRHQATPTTFNSHGNNPMETSVGKLRITIEKIGLAASIL